MTDHLPECIYAPRNVDPVKGIEWGGQPCICDRLRACEQRVTDQVNREWAEISVDDEVRIWNEAIDAAREAVRHALGPMESTDPGQRDAALAAIDALRGEPNE